MDRFAIGCGSATHAWLDSEMARSELQHTVDLVPFLASHRTGVAERPKTRQVCTIRTRPTQKASKGFKDIRRGGDLTGLLKVWHGLARILSARAKPPKPNLSSNGSLDARKAGRRRLNQRLRPPGRLRIHLRRLRSRRCSRDTACCMAAHQSKLGICSLCMPWKPVGCLM